MDQYKHSLAITYWKSLAATVRSSEIVVFVKRHKVGIYRLQNCLLEVALNSNDYKYFSAISLARVRLLESQVSSKSA